MKILILFAIVVLSTIFINDVFAQIADSITVATDKTSYLDGETILVTGEVSELLSGYPVYLSVIAPDGNLVSIAVIDVGSDKKYSAELTAGGALMSAKGTYTIKVVYGPEPRRAETTFTFGTLTQTISDQSSCEAIGGIWYGINTCTVSSLIINSGDYLYISGITLTNSGTIVNSGVIGNSGTINNLDTITNSGTIFNLFGAITNYSGATIVNSGIITNTEESIIANFGTINNFNAIYNHCDSVYFGTLPNGNLIEKTSCIVALSAFGTAKLSKSTDLFDKGTYDIYVEIEAEIDSVNKKGIPKFAKGTILGYYDIGDVDSVGGYLTNLRLTVDKGLKIIKWTAKEGSGEFKFATEIDFNTPEDQDGKSSKIIKLKVGKATFAPKVTSSSISYN